MIWTVIENMKHLVHLIPQYKQIGQINYGAFVVFLAELLAPILIFGAVSPFHLSIQFSTIISRKESSRGIHIPNFYLGLGFEFGAQRISDLA